MKKGSTRRIPHYRLVLLVLLGLMIPRCGSDVEVTFNLINPCKSDVLFGEGCQFIRLVVSSLSAGDDLYPGNNPGPLARECTIDKGNCGVSSSELLGPGRIVDIQCYVDRGSPPVARATSGALLLDDSGGGTFNLLIGNINGFIETTHLKGNEIGTCSTLAQDGGRFGHTATRLDDGRILIVGGIRRIGQVEEILATAEIFDPKTGDHRQIIGPGGRPLAMNASSGRAFHSATKLRDGNVLITGGVGIVQNKWASLRSSEVFDVGSETFPQGLIGITDKARANHTSTMLTTSGKVLVVGGAIYDAQTIVTTHDSAEVYDPTNNTWTAARNTMASARAFHAATELDPNADQGKVLITGGSDATGPLKSVEIYDPAANQFYPNVSPLMAVNRAHHCAVRMQNGEVMVAGGTTTGNFMDVNAGVEIYSSSLGGSFGGFRQQTLNLTNARMDHTCTLLEGTGDVLVAGGLTGSGLATGSGEVVIVDDGPVYSVNTLTDPMDPARYLHAAAALGNGWVFICGGLPSEAPDASAITQSLLFVPETPYQ
jgi:hypothetical protein